MANKGVSVAASLCPWSGHPFHPLMPTRIREEDNEPRDSRKKDPSSSYRWNLGGSSSSAKSRSDEDALRVSVAASLCPWSGHPFHPLMPTRIREEDNEPRDSRKKDPSSSYRWNLGGSSSSAKSRSDEDALRSRC
ncbi:hypothetical protein TanjilG_00111 [Lupinus angustifolius]|uniref:Uncharacterized protein n=1 Tax=Lupinus angustifolius TaxID=3871 RepID=A0A394D006_LUPAN|nr:hypothetical protein TanjilG_00111 [Lupinus angustifolius]